MWWVFVHCVKTNFCDWFNKERNVQQPGRSYRWDFQAERETGDNRSAEEIPTRCGQSQTCGMKGKKSKKPHSKT